MKTLNKCGRQNYPTRRDKEEFVYMYRIGFAQIKIGKYWKEFAKQKLVKWLGNRARYFFGYSPNYPNADIVWNFHKIYLRMEGGQDG